MNVTLDDSHGIRLAVEGCGHGTLHAIYASVAEACRKKGWPGIDLLIIGGDFQAVRNAYDLNCVSMPAKYRSMCDFHEYYSGQRSAPYLTLFIGGNHEASNYLFELYYGGWAAPNIYYMGAANVLRLGPLRIAALGGIWKGYNYRKPHHERLPYNESDMRSIYHVRELDVRKLLQIRTQVDIGISHDWPNGVEWKGNSKQLFRFKPHLEEDAREGRLGSVAAQEVMDWLRPGWWFSAHLHCKYAAVIEHEGQGSSSHDLPVNGSSTVPKNAESLDLDLDFEDDATDQAGNATASHTEIDLDLDGVQVPSAATSGANGANTVNADELDLDLDDELDEPAATDHQQTGGEVGRPTEPALEAARAALPESFRRPPQVKPPERPADISNKVTNFLALDKCLPGKHFLQLMTLPSGGEAVTIRPLQLQYDREWLAITRTFALDEALVLDDRDAERPKLKSQSDYQDAIDKRRLWVDEHIDDVDLVILNNFEVTAPIYDGGNWNLPQYAQVLEYPNPQTARFCDMLQIPNPFGIDEEECRQRLAAGPKPDPDAERFGGGARGRGSGGRNRGGGRGRGRGNFRGRSRGR